MRLRELLFGLSVFALSFTQAPGAESLTDTPTAQTFFLLALGEIDHYRAPVVDAAAALLEDEVRESAGLPPRFAISCSVEISPLSRGTWEDLPGGSRVWRLRVSSPGAPSLNLGFTRFALPEAARLLVYAADFSNGTRAYTAADNAAHGELWTPVVLADDIVIELTVPAESAGAVALTLGSVNVGYRDFGKLMESVGRSGDCMVDVICPEGDDWRREIPAVGLISLGGDTFCTGFMVNNTARDGRPYFMTALHCTVDINNAPSLVVYWNYESPSCDAQCCGSYVDNQTGSYFRAGYAGSDFVLVELDELPDPAWGVTYVGWDRTGANAQWAVGIHHPSTDEKSINFELHPTTTSTNFVTVPHWETGSTEPGSSGSPLFNQDHRVIGQFHTGASYCENPNTDSYGRFSVSWVNGLSQYLDPLGTGASTVDGYLPIGMIITPSTRLASVGDEGGPFTPASQVYAVQNVGQTAFSFDVSDDASWVDVAGGSGLLGPGESAEVTVSLNAAASDLPASVHHATVSFRNLSTGEGDTQRDVALQVGQPSLQATETLDTDPGWTAEGNWAFGRPAGLGGPPGYPDPSSGYTGANVYGYNLNGNYTNNMPMYSLISTPFDCSDLSATRLRFRRWLNAESPPYDWFAVWVSNDGASWTLLWHVPMTTMDNSWQYVEYDMSEVADYQSTVYLRWTMGPTDGSVTYSGWNIDDVEIWGIQRPTVAAEGSTATRSVLLDNLPNPLNAKTEIRYVLPAAGEVQLSIFDAAGRRVATLVDDRQDAGPHSIIWDGRNHAGVGLPAGVYLARIETPTGTTARKVVLAR